MASKRNRETKKELALQMEKMLEGLADKYFSDNAPIGSLPSAEELFQIRTAANTLSIAHGRKVGPFPQTWQLFKYLENRHSNLTLTAFCEKLLCKMKKITLNPLTRISHVIAKHQNDDSPEVLKLKAIVRLLKQDEMPSIEALAGHDYFLTLKPFVSDAFKAALGKSKKENDFDHRNRLVPHHAALGWGAFADLWQQAKSWGPTNDLLNRFETCGVWLHSLNSKILNPRLLQIVQHNDALETCEEFRENEKKRLARERQRNSRAKVAEKVCRKA
jgi:hypothetical protein